MSKEIGFIIPNSYIKAVLNKICNEWGRTYKIHNAQTRYMCRIYTFKREKRVHLYNVVLCTIIHMASNIVMP